MREVQLEKIVAKEVVARNCRRMCIERLGVVLVQECVFVLAVREVMLTNEHLVNRRERIYLSVKSADKEPREPC
jgi:hypothetical protein